MIFEKIKVSKKKIQNNSLKNFGLENLKISLTMLMTDFEYIYIYLLSIFNFKVQSTSWQKMRSIRRCGTRYGALLRPRHELRL